MKIGNNRNMVLQMEGENSMECVNHKEVFRKMERKRTLLSRIRNRQLEFLGHIGWKKLTLKGHIKGNMNLLPNIVGMGGGRIFFKRRNVSNGYKV